MFVGSQNLNILGLRPKKQFKGNLGPKDNKRKPRLIYNHKLNPVKSSNVKKYFDPGYLGPEN